MSAGDFAAMISAIAAACGFFVAAFQVWGLRRDALASRAAEIASVALETDVVTRPNSADAGAGHSRWVYDFSVRNPGRLPVSSVEAS